MNKLILSIMSAAAVITVSVGSAGAYAATPDTAVAAATVPAQVLWSQPGAVGAATATPHALTRQEVYNQLVQAEKDGTLKKLDELYYGPGV